MQSTTIVSSRRKFAAMEQNQSRAGQPVAVITRPSAGIVSRSRIQQHPRVVSDQRDPRVIQRASQSGAVHTRPTVARFNRRAVS